MRLIAAAPGAGCRAPAVHAEVWMSSEAKTESKGMGDSGGECCNFWRGGECCNFWRGRAGNSLSRSSERVRLTEKPVNHDDAKRGGRDAGEKVGCDAAASETTSNPRGTSCHPNSMKTF